MVKIYQQPFAHAGTKQVIPDASDPQGFVSNEDGFTTDYELPDTDPSYKPIERSEFNGLMNMVTDAVGELQQFGFAKWQPITWPQSARVVEGGVVYRALTQTSQQPPHADWVPDILSMCFIVGEFYYFRHPTIKPGFAPLQGGLISGAYQGKNITEYPIWDYLQTAEGQLLCKTEAEWQAMTTAIWATLADGTEVGWDGIGGAPYYVQNLGAGTLRMPDLRGMYAEAAGFDSLDVGGVHGDGVRLVTGSHQYNNAAAPGTRMGNMAGAFSAKPGGPISLQDEADTRYYIAMLDISRVVPVANKNQPRAFGVLPCVYLGTPK